MTSLLISQADESDSGRYTCDPTSSYPQSILVHVTKGKHHIIAYLGAKIVMRYIILDFVHIAWKLLKILHLNFLILAFSTNFCPVWPQTLDFQKVVKLPIFGIFNELLSAKNVNPARFACNIFNETFLWFSNTVIKYLTFCSNRSYLKDKNWWKIQMRHFN